MILVTGGTGFIGAYILKELIEKGHKVRGIKRTTSKLPFFISEDILSKVEWVDGDVLDYVSLEEAMHGADAVIHSAAIVSFHASDKNKLYQTNIEGTANVVNAALETSVRRFVHVSSVASLGRKGDGTIVDEEKKWQESRVNTHYSISKYYAEMEVWRGIGEGLNSVIVNPSTVLGYGDWNTSSCAIFKNAYREFPWYTKGINGFVDVEDVARSIVLLLNSEIHAERFILNGENWSFEKLLRTMAEHLHRRAPFRHATPFLGSVAWRIEKVKAMLSGKRPLLTQQSAKVAQSKTLFTNAKILKALPDFRFTPLESTIKSASSKYLQHLAIAGK